MPLVLQPVQGLPFPDFPVLQAAITSYLPLAGGLTWEFQRFNPDFFLSGKYIGDAASAMASAGAVLSCFPGATASHYLLLAIGWWPTLGVPAF